MKILVVNLPERSGHVLVGHLAVVFAFAPFLGDVLRAVEAEHAGAAVHPVNGVLEPELTRVTQYIQQEVPQLVGPPATSCKKAKTILIEKSKTFLRKEFETWLSENS